MLHELISSPADPVSHQAALAVAFLRSKSSTMHAAMDLPCAHDEFLCITALLAARCGEGEWRSRRDTLV